MDLEAYGKRIEIEHEYLGSFEMWCKETPKVVNKAASLFASEQIVGDVIVVKKYVAYSETID
jgi:hypothetical protein